MSTQIPTFLLKTAREKAELSQSQLAAKLEVSASVVSRLEGTEFVDPRMAERYLLSVKTDFATQILDYYKQHWQFIERPPFIHPERTVLWTAEQAMQILDQFEKEPQFDSILQDPLSKLKSRIITETDFIRLREHGIAFIGRIGDGKTTALSFVTNLVATDKNGTQQSVFPTGSGRTTVCEVAIKIAPAFGIAVDSLPEEEIRLLVSDLVIGLDTGKGGLSSELERVIRNMADLRRTSMPSKDSNEKPKTVDPLKEIIDSTEDRDQVIAEVISRMKLETRTEAQMILSESAEGNLDWLATNIAKINYGQHPGFSVPQRITVLLPLKALRETPYSLSVIDTKGVDGTTQRPDLKAQIDDPRTVTVLCTKFPDAPGETPMSVMREALESGSDALDAGHLCLLVLPRDDEALRIVDDSGNTPDSAEEGYAIRELQICQQFATEGLPNIPINFYNVKADKPEDTWAWLASRIEHVRANKIVRINRLIEAANDLVTNSDVAKTRQARLAIANTMKRAIEERFRQLPGIIRPAHQNLVSQIKKTHQRSIAASIGRRGNWENFPVFHILGVGVRTDMNLRSRETFVRIDEQIEVLKSTYAHLLDIKQFLESLQYDLSEWKQEFLRRTELMGRIAFSHYLKGTQTLWNDCETRYGAGSGYKLDVSDIFQRHFEEDGGAIAASNKVEASLTKIWSELVIDPLMETVHFEEGDV